jgi:hypothetical protein
VRKSERETRLLREEAARAKQQTAQVRAACANDVRKRDVQIQRLKTHLNDQQRGASGSTSSARGKRDAAGVMKIVIVPGNKLSSSSAMHTEAKDVDSYKYDLRNETTDFLTNLSQELSDENDNLIALIRNSLTVLKEVQGLPKTMSGQAGDHGSETDDQDRAHENNMVQAPPMSYSALSGDMEHVLDNLRNLLTNPNFVPIEEVQERDEEIQKLRSGWEKMEGKWREAILMMDGWRKRMSEGEAVNLNDIKQGLGLGRDLGSMRGAGGRRGLLSESVMAVVEDSLTELESSRILEGISESESEDVDGECSGDFDETGAPMTMNFTEAKFTRPLAEGDGNVHRSPRRVTFKSSHDGQHDRFQLNRENHAQPDISLHVPVSPKRVSVISASPSPVLFIDPLRKQRKRSSSPTPLPEERTPKLTVQEKLNVAQAEAEAAIVAAGLNLEDFESVHEGLEHLRKQGTGHERTTRPDEDAEQGQDHERVHIKTIATTTSTRGIKRTRISGRARRRKSTLTPQELEELMLNC